VSGVRRVLVPGSLAMDTQNPRLETYKIGQVGRALAVFGVDEVVVYEDPDERKGRKVARILEYQAAAPYLRKRIFPISEELEHVGVLPPLNLPLHKVPRWTEAGQVRYGAMAGRRVDIGLDKLAEFDGDEEPDPGEQFPVEVTAAHSDRVLVEPYEPDEDEHIGFEASRTPSLSTADPDGPVLGTSREGEPLTDEHLEDGPVTLALGSPRRGLQQILDDEPEWPMVNTIPGQHTESVRLEEALVASLGVINDRTA